MILLFIVILVIGTCLFPWIWVIVPIGLVFTGLLQVLLTDKETENYRRQKRLEECRRRRYGRRR